MQGTSDRLQGYKVIAIEIRDPTFLAKGEQKDQLTIVFTNNENDLIGGTALELTEEELLITDKYEPGNYRRSKIKLLSGEEATIYVAVETA